MTDQNDKNQNPLEPNDQNPQDPIQPDQQPEPGMPEPKEEQPQAELPPKQEKEEKTFRSSPEEELVAEVSEDAKTWATFCHLSALIGLVFPFGNVIAPLIIWLIKRDQYDFVDKNGKEALNFQISMSVYGLISFLLMFVCVGMILLPAVIIVDVIFLIIAAVKAHDAKIYRYPLTIRFIK